MPSDPTRKNPSPSRTSALDMIDALIGTPDKPAKKTKGRSVLLAHAMAQRENRLKAEKRAAASRMNETKQRDPKDARAADATPPQARQAAARPEPAAKPKAPARTSDPAERPGLDAMIVKALGPSARGYVRGGALDRESALTDLIARTQDRLNSGAKPAAASHQPAAVSAPQSGPHADREAIIAAAMRTHREQQAIFDELSLRQRATLRATAEAMVARGGRSK